jgi:hypothetical protein
VQRNGAGALEASLLGGGCGLDGEAEGVASGGVERDQVDRQHRLDRVAQVERGELVEAVLHGGLPGAFGASAAGPGRARSIVVRACLGMR